MSGICPTNGIRGFPLELKDSSNVKQDQYKAPGIDYVTELIDLQWGSETPNPVSNNGTSVYLQDNTTNTALINNTNSTVIFNRVQFKLYSVQIVNTTHRKFITDTTDTGGSSRAWSSAYLYDLFILFQNVGSDSNDSFIAFIIPIKHDLQDSGSDPNYFTAAINRGSATLASTIPSGKLFVHYSTCFNGYTASNTQKRKYLHVFLCTEPIRVKPTTIKQILLKDSINAEPPNLPFVLPTNFGTAANNRATLISISEFYQYIQTTTFGVTNKGDDGKAKGIITDSTDQYQCLQLDPDKIDNNSLHFDMINGEIKTSTSLNALIEERTALKMIMNGEASGGGGNNTAGRIKNRTAYATALAVIISIILFVYIYFSILNGNTRDIRNISQFVVALLSILFFFIAFMVFLYNDTTISQWLGGTAIILSFFYWLIFYVIFPGKKECGTDTTAPGTPPPGTPAPGAPANPNNSAPWTAWIPKWWPSEPLRTGITITIMFLIGFITGATNG